MTVTYTGKLTLSNELDKKLAARYAKIEKLLGEGNGRKAHVVLDQQRHLQTAEITIGQDLVSAASGTDHFTALMTALEKMEKQILKTKAKDRAPKRENRDKFRVLAVPDFDAEGEPTGDTVQRKVYAVEEPHGAKPLTLDEALLELAPTMPYLVYRDADDESLRVLIRRPDGHFDLVQCLG